MNTVGEKIRIQRLMKNYTQEYMAFALDITQGAYSNLERDSTKITLDRIFEIAEILEISPFILMPKPKFGVGINPAYFWKTLSKLKQLWRPKTLERLKNIPADLKVNESDIPN